jgi:tetratricopeptide (TPR) repeat protein
LLTGVAVVWTAKSWSYLSEWRDPRSVWYAATAKSTAYQGYELLGKVYQEAGERMSAFLGAGPTPKVVEEMPLARAVLNDRAREDKLRQEWTNPSNDRSVSRAYRDRLWELAGEEFDSAIAHRGTINAPNSYLRRGKLRVDQGRAADAIADLKMAYQLSQAHTYLGIRQETGTQTARGVAIAYWQIHDYKQARDWLLQAKRIQDASPRRWVPTLEQEIERVTPLAEAQP